MRERERERERAKQQTVKQCVSLSLLSSEQIYKDSNQKCDKTLRTY